MEGQANAGSLGGAVCNPNKIAAIHVAEGDCAAGYDFSEKVSAKNQAKFLALLDAKQNP